MAYRMEKIGVIGGGAWGTALAVALAHKRGGVLLWALEGEVVDAVNGEHCNSLFLPGVALPKEIKATNRLTDMTGFDALLMVAPAQYMGAVCRDLQKEGLSEKTALVLCAKGIERESLRLMSEVVRGVFPKNPIAVLSGPSFAKDISQNLPTAMTLASADMELAEALAGAMGHSLFRIYLSDDIIGAQIGGAVKNVLAIAAGIVIGKGWGESARASIVSRGFAEMLRLSAAMGGRRKTLSGLCGIGDLMLTCGSTLSRNFSLGQQLGQGKTLEEARKGKKNVSEGALSAKAVVALAKKHDCSMPICEAVAKIIENAPLDETISALLQRKTGVEVE